MLTGARETDLPRLLAMKQGRRRRRGADQIVAQKRRPQLLADHRRRLAAGVIQTQRLLDASDVQFRTPYEL